MKKLMVAGGMIVTIILAYLMIAITPANAGMIKKPKPGWWCDKHSSQPIKWCTPIVRPIPPRKF